ALRDPQPVAVVGVGSGDVRRISWTGRRGRRGRGARPRWGRSAAAIAGHAVGYVPAVALRDHRLVLLGGHRAWEAAVCVPGVGGAAAVGGRTIGRRGGAAGRARQPVGGVVLVAHAGNGPAGDDLLGGQAIARGIICVGPGIATRRALRRVRRWTLSGAG